MQVAFCRVTRTRLIAEEVDSPTLRSDVLRAALSSEGTATNAALYLLLRAVDRFIEAHQRAPGTEAEDCEADVPVLKSFSVSILSESGAQSVSSAISDDLLGKNLQRLFPKHWPESRICCAALPIVLTIQSLGVRPHVMCRTQAKCVALEEESCIAWPRSSVAWLHKKQSNLSRGSLYRSLGR